MDRLKSRKLWIAILSTIIMFLEGQYQLGVATTVAYLGTQGILDCATAIYPAPQSPPPASEDPSQYSSLTKRDVV